MPIAGLFRTSFAALRIFSEERFAAQGLCGSMIDEARSNRAVRRATGRVSAFELRTRAFPDRALGLTPGFHGFMTDIPACSLVFVQGFVRFPVSPFQPSLPVQKFGIGLFHEPVRCPVPACARCMQTIPGFFIELDTLGSDGSNIEGLSRQG